MTTNPVSIPLSQFPSQKFRVVLGGQNCIVSIYQRGDFMYMDLAVNKNTIMTGAICLSGIRLIQYRDINFRGNLYFVDLNGGTGVPNFKEFNSRFALLYLDEVETNVIF